MKKKVTVQLPESKIQNQKLRIQIGLFEQPELKGSLSRKLKKTEYYRKQITSKLKKGDYL